MLIFQPQIPTLLPLPFHAGQYLATPVKAAEDICLSVRAPPLANSQNILLSSGLSTQALLLIGGTSYIEHCPT